MLFDLKSKNKFFLYARFACALLQQITKNDINNIASNCLYLYSAPFDEIVTCESLQHSSADVFHEKKINKFITIFTIALHFTLE